MYARGLAVGAFDYHLLTRHRIYDCSELFYWKGYITRFFDFRLNRASYAEFKVGGREHYVAAFRLNKHIVQNRHLRFRAYDVCDLFEACREVFLADFKLHNGVSVLPGGR